MATVTTRSDKQWQVKTSKKGYPVQCNTFHTKARAERWTRHVEPELDSGIYISTTKSGQTH